MLCMGGAGSGCRSPLVVFDRFPSEVKGDGNHSQGCPVGVGGLFTLRHREVWKSCIKVISSVRKVPKTITKDTGHCCPSLPTLLRIRGVPIAGTGVVLTPPHKICVSYPRGMTLSLSAENQPRVGNSMMCGDSFPQAESCHFHTCSWAWPAVLCNTPHLWDKQPLWIIFLPLPES